MTEQRPVCEVLAELESEEEPPAAEDLERRVREGDLDARKHTASPPNVDRP